MDPEEVRDVLDQANELLEAGKPEESLQCLEQLENGLLDGDDQIELGSLKAWALSELGRTDDALDALEPLMYAHDDSARLYGTLGVVLSNDGDLDEACFALERAVQLDGEDEVALANLALVYEKLREYEQALDLYDKALNMGAEIDWLLKRKAYVQSELGRLRDARSTLKRYLSLAPEDQEQWISLAILCSDELDFDEAFHCYRAAEQIAPDSASLRLNWGVTASRARQTDAAREQLAYLTRLEPDSSRPLLLDAFIAEEQQDLKTAARLYADALAKVQRKDYAELTYALEMAMDFFARHQMCDPCEQLLDQAYFANACTVELCEAYREAMGSVAAAAHWYSVIVEGDYRAGLEEVSEPGDAGDRPLTRFLRNYQLIAKDHDEGMAMAMEFAQRMGEVNVLIREFVNEEPIENAYLGVYEVDRESMVFGDDEID